MIWITDLLKSKNIPLQISGGLAAKAYGVTRDLADIDIREDKFDLLEDEINQFITFGPERIKGEQWNYY